MKTVPDQSQVMRRVLEKDETTFELVHLEDVVLIKTREGWMGGTLPGKALTHLLEGEGKGEK